MGQQANPVIKTERFDRFDPDEGEVELCRQRDRGALHRVLRAHTPPIRAVLRGNLGWGPDAEDALQKVYEKAIEGFPEFRGGSTVRTWLIGIAINVARDERRRQWRGMRHVPPEDTELTDAAPRADRILHARSVASRLEVHMGKLTDKGREVYTLHVLLQYTLQETADLLHVPIETAKSRLLRARQALERSLAGDPIIQEAMTRSLETSRKEQA